MQGRSFLIGPIKPPHWKHSEAPFRKAFTGGGTCRRNPVGSSITKEAPYPRIRQTRARAKAPPSDNDNASEAGIKKDQRPKRIQPEASKFSLSLPRKNLSCHVQYPFG